MGTSVIEKIVGNNVLFKTYIQDTINLAKSINIKNDNEAKLYNEYVKRAYPTHVIDLANRKTWRYYKHLAGQYHAVDKPILITSLDNGQEINLNRYNMSIHIKTRKELLKFGLLYKQLIDAYPEQELYIKSVICDKQYENIEDIVDLEDFSITSYNTELIEENEIDLMYQLQETINSYKNIWLIPYYALSDNLFLASQYHVFYNYIVTKILAIRLKNAKTFKAHTFHIKNYLASHHYLDKYYPYLTKRQALFLYKNLLYLNNHTGLNNIFNTLIDRLFTERNVSIVNYTYSQENEIDESSYIKYRFKQKLLNRANLVYYSDDFSLQDIKHKEINLTPGNYKELTYNLDTIDSKFKNSLFNELLTKDLESIVVDNTDTVRYKFIPMLVDYWAYLLKNNRINYLVSITDSTTNLELNLNTKDLFKLFVVVLYKLNTIELTQFPAYTISRVFREDIPTAEELLRFCYRPKFWYKHALNNIINSIVPYSTAATSLQFWQFIFSVYKLNMGLWILTSNYSDKNNNGQFEYMIERLHKSEEYSFNDETVENFLSRIGLSNLMSYSTDSLESLSYSILNNLCDNRLDFIDGYKNIQKALIEVFKKFNSYTVQLISNYYSSSPILLGSKDVRYCADKDINIKVYYYDYYRLNVDMQYRVNLKETLDFRLDTTHSYSYFSTYNVDLVPKVNIEDKSVQKVALLFNNKILNDLGGSTWPLNQTSSDQLLFLALNL